MFPARPARSWAGSPGRPPSAFAPQLPGAGGGPGAAIATGPAPPAMVPTRPASSRNTATPLSTHTPPPAPPPGLPSPGTGIRAVNPPGRPRGGTDSLVVHSKQVQGLILHPAEMLREPGRARPRGEAGRSPLSTHTTPAPSSPRFMFHRHRRPRRSPAAFASRRGWFFSPGVKHSPGPEPLTSPPAAPHPPCPHSVTLWVLRVRGQTRAWKETDGRTDGRPGLGGGGAAAALPEGSAPSDHGKGKLF